MSDTWTVEEESQHAGLQEFVSEYKHHLGREALWEVAGMVAGHAGVKLVVDDGKERGLRIIDGGREHFGEGDEVLVGGRWARVGCGSLGTHVYRGMVSVQYDDGELDLLAKEQVERMEAG